MASSAFCELCRERNVCPEVWRRSLATPLIPRKSVLDMTEEELEDHYFYVESRALKTQEDRALLCLERVQDGVLEHKAVRLFEAHCHPHEFGHLEAEQVAGLLEALRFNVNNVELHYLLRRLECTDGFDMIPDALLTRRQWLRLVGECIMLKESYQVISQEAFEICYETHLRNIQLEEDSAYHSDQVLAGIAPELFSLPPASPSGTLHLEVESELMTQMAEDFEVVRAEELMELSPTLGTSAEEGKQVEMTEGSDDHV